MFLVRLIGRILLFPLWLAFVLPGKILTYVDYYFPGRGGVLATGRRKDSLFAHIVISVFLWAFGLFLLTHALQR